MKFVVGLGNPGRKYHGTRHNLGWRVVDGLADVLGGGNARECWDGMALRCADVTLFKPLTYMNDSGRAVGRLVAESGTGLQDLLIVLDDLSLDLGILRLRPGGASAGHRGLQSVMDCLGSDEFARLRLGIGPCPEGVEWLDFVLEPFDKEQAPLVELEIQRAVEAAQCWLKDGLDAAMSRYNGPVEKV